MRKSTSKWLSSLVVAGTFVAGITTASAEPIKIAIANFGEHPQLNASIAGFKKALAENGFVEGKDVVYSESNTSFDASLVPQMIAKLQAEHPKLMYTVTTPVSQIARRRSPAPAFRSSSPRSPIRSLPSSSRPGMLAMSASPVRATSRIFPRS